jgi:hypothetical protein
MATQDKSANRLINTISKDFEIWEEITEFGSKFYLVAQLPSFEGSGGVFTWRYQITDWNAVKEKTAGNNLVANVVVDSDFNIIEGTSSITAQDYSNSFYFGEANQLLFSKAEEGAEPYDHLVEALKEEAKYSEWILSEDENGRLDFLAIAIEAALEGQQVRAADLQRTSWWQTHTPSERAAAELFASDPAAYKEKVISNQQAIVDGMVSRGIQTINPDVVSGLTNLMSKGTLNERIRYTLDPEVQAVLTGQSFDAILATRDLATSIDNILGPGASENYDLEAIYQEAQANPAWYNEVFVPQIQDAFQTKYSQFKGTAVKSYESAAGVFRGEWNTITGQMPDETSNAWQSFFATNDVEERRDIAFAEAARLGTQTYRDTLKGGFKTRFGEAGQRATGGGRFQ